jgi:Zn ribbon nucleic-acid-binding protein
MGLLQWERKKGTNCPKCKGQDTGVRECKNNNGYFLFAQYCRECGHEWDRKPTAEEKHWWYGI